MDKNVITAIIFLKVIKKLMNIVSVYIVKKKI